jgi:uncharacterized lipoprotein YddW (UPF0748 family)
MIRRRNIAFALLLISGLYSFCLTQQKELRGVWVTAREGNALWTKGRIGAVMDSIAANGFNTVYFNAWSRGFPLWRSDVFEAETGYPTDPAAGSRDILKEAIAEAHRVGLELEAWMEYGYVAFWSGYNPTGNPKGPLFNNHPDWLARDLLGSDEFVLGGGLGYYHWMSHNHPAVHAFMVALHAEIAHNYDIDGIELDRIRYPNLNCGYDSVSVERYKSDHGGIAPPTNTGDPGWMRWRADILNAFHASVFDSIKAANPNVIVSNAPSHYGTGASYPAYQNFLQDWKAWVNNGDVDAVQVQMYVAPALLQSYIASALLGISEPSKVMAGIAAVSGGTTYPLSDVLSMISIVRSAGLQGHCIWYYNDLETLGYLAGLKAQAYQSEAIAPYREEGWRDGGMFFDESNTIRTLGWTGVSYAGARGGFFYYSDTLVPAALEFAGTVPADAWYEVYAYLFPGLSNLATGARYEIYSDGAPAETIVVNQAGLSQPVTAGWTKLGDSFLRTGGQRTIFGLANDDVGAGRYLMVDDMMLILNRKLSPSVVVSVFSSDYDRVLPIAVALGQNYPNPFNSTTTIRFTLPSAMEISLEVFDTLGRRVATLVDGERPSGNYSIRFESKALPSGVYFAQLHANGAVKTQKMVLTR